MRNMRTVVLAGIAALALAGTAYAAAQRPALHRMTVKTPDGGIATIEYSGNVAPKVTFGTVPTPASFFGPVSPFAAFNRISTAMDHEMNVLLRQANMLTVPFGTPSPLYNATLRRTPRSGGAYSMVTRFSGNGVCMRAMQITRTGNGKPHVVTQTSGDCSATGQPGLRGAGPATVPKSGNGMLEAVHKAPAHHKLPMFYEAGYTPH